MSWGIMRRLNKLTFVCNHLRRGCQTYKDTLRGTSLCHMRYVIAAFWCDLTSKKSVSTTNVYLSEGSKVQSHWSSTWTYKDTVSSNVLHSSTNSSQSNNLRRHFHVSHSSPQPKAYISVINNYWFSDKLNNLWNLSWKDTPANHLSIKKYFSITNLSTYIIFKPNPYLKTNTISNMHQPVVEPPYV